MIILKGEELYEKRDKLKLVKQLNWVNYYVDENMGEKWAEEFPQSNLHGGGSPQLKKLDKLP